MANQLDANFTAAYTSVAHGTVLDTDAEGVQIGSLTALVAGAGAALSPDHHPGG